MAKKAIIYHDKCNDGLCSVCVAIEALEKDNDLLLIPAEYKKETNIFNYSSELNDRETIFLDFNLEPHLMNQLLPLVKNVTVIDHHQTSFDNYSNFVSHTKDGFTYLDYNEKCKLILDMNRSGALMAWDYFNNKPAPKMVEYISDGDLYRFKNDNTIPFLSRLSAEEKSIDSFTALLHKPDEFITQFTKEGMLLAQQFDNLCKSFMQKTTDIEIDIEGVKYYGTSVLCGGDSAIRSRVGELIYNQNNTFAAIISQMTDKEVEISFRSSNRNPDNIYNILPIAGYFGGGGHKTAGACKMDLETFHKHFTYLHNPLKSKLKL